MNHDVRHRLEELLSREITAAQSLAQLLAAERAALTGDSSEVVKELAAEKIGLSQKIFQRNFDLHGQIKWINQQVVVTG